MAVVAFQQLYADWKMAFSLFPKAFFKMLHATCNSSHGFATTLENLIKENKLCKLTQYKLYCLYNKNYRLLLVGNFYSWLTCEYIFLTKMVILSPILSLIPRDHSTNDPDVPESENRLYPGRSLSLFPTISLSVQELSFHSSEKSRLEKFVNGTNRYTHRLFYGNV